MLSRIATRIKKKKKKNQTNNNETKLYYMIYIPYTAYNYVEINKFTWILEAESGEMMWGGEGSGFVMKIKYLRMVGQIFDWKFNYEKKIYGFYI